MIIVLQSQDINQLIFTKNLLADPTFRQEYTHSIGHITLFHQVSNHTDRDFKIEPVRYIFQINIGLVIFQF